MKTSYLFLFSGLFLLSITLASAQSDSEFIKKAASGGMMEVALGKVAQKKAISNDVKQFGARMVKDHSKANDQLMQLAKNKKLAIPNQLMDEHQKHIDKLSATADEKFDQAYMDVMLKDHKKDIKEFEDAIKEVKDNEIRAWVQQTLPVLKEHYEMAQIIEDNL